jgi:hypothetical protein
MNNPYAQVVSVTRVAAAEPYITDFWPGNTSVTAVTAATLPAVGRLHHYLCTPAGTARATASANPQSVDATPVQNCIPPVSESALTCDRDGGNQAPGEDRINRLTS